MRLERLEYFAVLAEELHFSRAAARLYLSQPALSQQIKRLESDLGVRLCERDAHGVRLTAEGQRLAAGGSTLIAAYKSLISEVIGIGQGTAGVLRIALTRSDGDGIGRALVQDFRERHPEVEVQTHAGWTSWNLEMLARHEIDAAIVRMPVSEDGVRVARIGESEISAVLPTNHPLTGRRRLQAADLTDETVVFWPRQQAPGAYDALLSALFPASSPPPIHQEPDAENILAAVMRGGGIGLLDRQRVRRTRGLVTRRFAAPTPRIGIGLAWRQDQISPQLRAFLSKLTTT